MGVLLRTARCPRAAAGRPRRQQRAWRRRARRQYRRRRRRQHGGTLRAGAMPAELAVHCIAYAVHPVHCMHSRRALPMQVVPAELLYAPSSSAVNFTQTYPMDYTYNHYNEPLRRRFRAAAHAVLPAPPLRTAPPHRPLLPSMHPQCTLSLSPPPSAALRRPPLPSAALCRPLPPSAALCRPLPPSLTLRHTLPPSAGARRGRGPGASCAAATRARGVAAVAARLLTHPRRACARHRQDRRPTRNASWPRVFPPWAAPELGSCELQRAHGGSGWLSTPRGEAAPLGGQPLPQVLKLAASKVADSTTSVREPRWPS